MEKEEKFNFKKWAMEDEIIEAGEILGLKDSELDDFLESIKEWTHNESDIELLKLLIKIAKSGVAKDDFIRSRLLWVFRCPDEDEVLELHELISLARALATLPSLERFEKIAEILVFLREQLPPNYWKIVSDKLYQMEEEIEKSERNLSELFYL
ncbi:hypothetical protein [Thermococcus sp.]